MTRTKSRPGFTLVEMLVGLSIIAFLAGFVLIAYPGARDQDRVRNTVGDVTSALKMAQGMAARDRAPRGVRFLVDPDTTKPATDRMRVTELQYIELPPPIVFSLKPLTVSAANPTANPALEPRVRFAYKIAPATSTNPLPGTITDRQCFVDNISNAQADQIKAGMQIVLPGTGASCRISSPGARSSVGPGLFNQEVILEGYPDTTLGGGTSAVFYYFALYPGVGSGSTGGGAGGGAISGAVPLIGEPTMLLPQNICVDLNPYDPTNGFQVGSLGPPRGIASDFDVVFGPDGKLMNGQGGLFLLVRAYNKVPTMQLPVGAQLGNAFLRSGEQFFVSVRASGTIGRAEVAFPDMNTASPTFGQYTAGDAFSLARQDQN